MVQFKETMFQSGQTEEGGEGRKTESQEPWSEKLRQNIGCLSCLLDHLVRFGTQLASSCINDSVVMYLVIDKRELAFLFRSCMDKLNETFIYKEHTDSIFPTLFPEDICVLIRALHSESPSSFFSFHHLKTIAEFLTKCLLLRKSDIKQCVKFRDKQYMFQTNQKEPYFFKQEDKMMNMFITHCTLPFICIKYSSPFS